MTDCRSSRLLGETRGSSPCAWALTPFGPSSLMILDTFLAFSWVMPSLIAIAIRYSLPEILGSAASRCFNEMPRLTSFSLNTSRIALARSSLLARISTPFSPDQAMDAPTLRKSNRVLISLAAWLSALSASWRSIFETMSKLDSLGMDHRVDGYGAAHHLGHAVVAGRSSLPWSRTAAGRSASQPLAMSAILLSAAAAVRGGARQVARVAKGNG